MQTGTFYFKFSIWDQSDISGGNRLWPINAPTSTPITVSSGVFNVNIGDIANGYPTNLDYNFYDNSDVYLEVKVSSDDSNFETLSPRQRITSAGFSINANAVASSTPGVGPNQLLKLDSSANLGVGTSTGLFARTTIAGLTSDSTTAAFSVINSASTSLFFVRNDGNVGIGTTSPGSALSVNSTGNVYFGGGLTVSGSSFFTNASSTYLSLTNGFWQTNFPTCTEAQNVLYNAVTGKFSCGDDNSTAGAGIATVKEGGTTATTTADTIVFNTSYFDVSTSSQNTVNITLNPFQIGSSTYSLQYAYNAATSTPEIILTSAIGGLTIQDAASALNTNLFEVLNTSGSPLFAVTATSTTILNASTTLATLPTFWSTTGTITNASTTLATLPTFWSTTGTIANASTTNLTGTNFWSTAGTIGTLTLTNDLTVANGGTGASTLTGLLQGNGTNAITAITGTAGQIPYYNGTNTLLATSTIFLSTANQVGIGTSTGLFAGTTIAGSGSTSATAALSVINSASTSLLFIRNDGNVGIASTSPWGKLSVQASDNDSIPQFIVASSTATSFIVNQYGNVGIGTTPASGIDLHLKKTGSSVELRIENTTSGNAILRFMENNVEEAAIFTNSAADLTIRTLGSDNLIFQTGAVERARIDTSGRMGIGTSSPGWLLSVNGDGYFAGNLNVASSTTLLNASTTLATLPTFWSTTGTITNASTTLATLPTFWSTTGTITNASTTLATLPTFWSTTGTIANASTTNLSAATYGNIGGVALSGGLITSTSVNSVSVVNNSLGAADLGGQFIIAGTNITVSSTSDSWTINSTGGTGTTYSPQNSYNAATSTPEIILTSAIGGLTIQDASSALATNLFEVNSGSGGLLFSVSATSTVASATTTLKSAFLQTGLTDCSNPTTGKLYYDLARGLILCGSDTAGAGVTVSFQNAYNGATSSPEILLNSTIGSFTIQDAASALGTNLFEINSGSGGLLFAVAATSTTITNASTTYATLPTFWSTTGIITNASTTNASSTYLTVSDTAWINKLNVTGTATSTFAGSINLTGGCVAINGSCIFQSSRVFVVKPASQNTNTTTLTNDTDLKFSIGANETWIFTINVLFDNNSSAVPDWKAAITAPSGSTCSVSQTVFEAASGLDSSGVAYTSDCATPGTLRDTVIASDAGVNNIAYIHGVVSNGGTAGAVQLQWASDASAASLDVNASSTLMAWKVGGADLAEIYYSQASQGPLIPGTLLSIDGAIANGVKASEKPYDGNIIGVVSTRPNTVFGDVERGVTGIPTLVGLTGRVFLKVNLENGPIKAGDAITSSSVAGEGMKATRSGRVVGRALTDFEPDSGFCSSDGTATSTPDGANCQGVIIVFLNVGFSMDIKDFLTNPAEAISAISDVAAELADEAFEKSMDFAKLAVRKITAQVIVVKNLFASVFAILPGGDINLPSGENQIVGEGVFPRGAISVLILNNKTASTSKIFLTPRAVINSQLAVTEIREGEGFVVSVLSPPSQDIPFDWMVISTYTAGPNGKIKILDAGSPSNSAPASQIEPAEPGAEVESSPPSSAEVSNENGPPSTEEPVSEPKTPPVESSVETAPTEELPEPIVVEPAPEPTPPPVPGDAAQDSN